MKSKSIDMSVVSQEDKINSFIERSGNGFHYRVVNFLREQGWKVSVSPYYSDYASEKAKEIDLIAEKLFQVTEHWGKQIGCLRVRLFVECKYINDDIAFWFDDKEVGQPRELVLRNTPFDDNNSKTDSHHYLTETRAAKLFSTNGNKEDVIFKALTQSLHSMIYFRNKTVPIRWDKMYCTNTAIVNYPIILCDGFNRFHKVDGDLGSDHGPIKNDSFQLEVNYAYRNEAQRDQNEYFLVDVVDFSKFSDFLKGLEEGEIAEMKDLLSWKWDKDE